MIFQPLDTQDGPPGELLNGYAQEIGRAGRGQTPAWCIVLCSSRDVTAKERRDSDMAESERFRSFVQCHGCRWASVLASFDKDFRKVPGLDLMKM